MPNNENWTEQAAGEEYNLSIAIFSRVCFLQGVRDDGPQLVIGRNSSLRTLSISGIGYNIVGEEQDCDDEVSGGMAFHVDFGKVFDIV